MNETTNIVALRQFDEIDCPLIDRDVCCHAEGVEARRRARQCGAALSRPGANDPVRDGSSQSSSTTSIRTSASMTWWKLVWTHALGSRLLTPRRNAPRPNISPWYNLGTPPQ